MSFDLTNKNIQDTFQNLLQKTGSDGRLFDLEGNQVNDITLTNVSASGHISASKFVGDGSELTGLSSAAISTYNTSGDNRIITSVNSSTVQGEPNLTFNSDNQLTIGGDITSSGNISASGNITCSGIFLPKDKSIIFGSGDTKIETDTSFSEKLFIFSDSSIFLIPDEKIFASVDEFMIRDHSNRPVVRFDADEKKVKIGSLSPTDSSIPLATLHITGSGESNLFVEGNITSSGNISASGTGSFEHLIIGGGNFSSASLAEGGSGVSSYTDLTNIPPNIISSSTQIKDDISGSFVQASSSFSTRLTTAENELENTLISSSLQIASDISGSFIQPSGSFSTRTTDLEIASGSFSTRMTNNEVITSKTLVSSSTQIASDISGSFVEASSSFSTRLTTAESELGNTLISSSAQIASDISGSFTFASSSFSTRITTEETNVDALQTDSASFSTRLTTAENELENTLISSSAQIASDISGSFTSTSSSFSTRLTTEEDNIDALQTDSASFSTRITTEEVNVDALQIDSGSFSVRVESLEGDVGQSVNTNSDVTFNSINVTHFTSSFITSSTIITEGSNIFGDEIGDTQTFNGHITASGNISASGDVFADQFFSNDLLALDINGTDTRLGVNNTTTRIIIGKAGTTTSIQATGNITASGNISASGTSTGSFGRIQTNTLSGQSPLIIESDNLNLSSDGNLNVSGDISNTQTLQMTNSSSVVNTFNTSSHQTAKYLLQVTSASFIQSSELMVIQSSSNAFNTEYAQINSGKNLLDFTTKVVDSDVQLIGSGSFISCSVKFNRTLI